LIYVGPLGGLFDALAGVWPWLHVPAPAITEAGGGPPPSRFGTAALAIARAEIGHGEAGGNNIGPDLDRYRQGGVAGAWCAAFVSFCLESGAQVLDEPICPVARSHNAKRLFARCFKVGASVARPLPGDIVCWHRGAADALTGHIGIVSQAELHSAGFHVIEGNRGGYPSLVREYPHELGEALLLGFARLP
jgi:hypothetical protein